MFTEYDRQQQARERASLAASRAATAIENLDAAEVPQTCDWDAELAALTAPPADGPPPSDLHKPSHGGYPS